MHVISETTSGQCRAVVKGNFHQSGRDSPTAIRRDDFSLAGTSTNTLERF
jgi:hypothetical protein